jgi:ATP-dependent exoDNAse (exonuclease V) beta subunit
MPADSQSTHLGTTVTFRDEGHTYRDDRGTPYVSVTTLLHRYAQPFDAPATAARMEAQGKGRAADLLASWDANRDEACDYGTRCHETAEAILQGLPLPHEPRDEKERTAFASIWEFCQDTILPAFDVIACELLVFHPDWYVAGTIDLPLREKETGTVWLADWKTNRQIRREGFKGSTMLWPVSHLPDCELSRYSLQLSTYEWILRAAKWTEPETAFRRAIFHVTADGVEVIETDDLAKESAAILLDNLTGVPF